MLYINWQTFEFYANRLLQEIRQCGIEFKGIYGVPRGGLILAVWLSHRLGIPLLENDGPLKNSVLPYLIVDDINDTGETLKDFDGQPLKVTACLVDRYRSKHPSNFCGLFYEKDDWVVFPWEPSEKVKEDEERYNKKCHT